MPLNNHETLRFIGIDGGGTKTLCVLGDEQGELLAVSRGEGTNVKSRPWAEAQLTITELISDVLNRAGAELSQVGGIFLGLAGSDRIADRRRWIEYLTEQYPELAGRITIHNDAVSALMAGTWGDGGIVLISGTGSIACGFDPATGDYVRVGGWGYLLGDEGSGFDLGRKAITAVMKQYDGRGEKTLLTDLMMEQLGFSEPTQFILHYYEQNDVRKHIADASHFVLQAARAGDGAAQRIMHEAVDDLAFLAETVRIRMKAVGVIPLVVSGGLFSDPDFIRAFEETNIMKNGGYRIQPLELSPVIGSYILAMREAGYTITEQMKRTIKDQWMEKEAAPHGTE